MRYIRRLAAFCFCLPAAGLILSILLLRTSSAGEPTLAPARAVDAKPRAAEPTVKSPSADARPSLAQDVAPPGGNVLPIDLHDRAFDRYIDLQFLADAWAALDAAQLTDAALQLAEGERVLLRPHRAITADETLQLAAKTAVEQADAATLTRLAKIAIVRKDKELAAMIATTQKLGATSRSAGPAVDLASTSPTAYALLHACHIDLQRAKLAGDAKVLLALAQAIPAMPLLSAEQKEQLLAATKLPVAEGNERARTLPQTLRRLNGVGRCDPNDPTCGGYYLPTAAALEQTSRDPQLAPEVRTAAQSARDRLAGAMRQCDLADPSCFP